MRKNIFWMLAALFVIIAVYEISFSNKSYACEECDDEDHEDKGWF